MQNLFKYCITYSILYHIIHYLCTIIRLKHCIDFESEFLNKRDRKLGSCTWVSIPRLLMDLQSSFGCHAPQPTGNMSPNVIHLSKITNPHIKTSYCIHSYIDIINNGLCAVMFVNSFTASVLTSNIKEMLNFYLICILSTPKRPIPVRMVLYYFYTTLMPFTFFSALFLLTQTTQQTSLNAYMTKWFTCIMYS